MRAPHPSGRAENALLAHGPSGSRHLRTRKGNGPARSEIDSRKLNGTCLGRSGSEVAFPPVCSCSTDSEGEGDALSASRSPREAAPARNATRGPCASDMVRVHPSIVQCPLAQDYAPPRTSASRPRRTRSSWCPMHLPYTKRLLPKCTVLNSRQCCLSSSRHLAGGARVRQASETWAHAPDSSSLPEHPCLRPCHKTYSLSVVRCLECQFICRQRFCCSRI
mgnify:CR=1 FL=1